MKAFLGMAVPHVRLAHDFMGATLLQTLPVPRQIHDHALLYVERGTGTCTSVHAQPLSPGCLVVVPPYLPHRIELTHPDGIHMLNIHFDPVLRPDSGKYRHYLLDPAQPRPRGDSFPELATDRILVLPLRQTAAYVAAFRRVWRYFPATNTPDQLRLRGAMLELLAIVISECRPSELPPPPDPRLEAARRFLMETPTPVALVDVAALAGMGRSAFAAAFKAQYGLPPMIWHRYQRIEQAKLDLLDGRQPIKAVAQRWGFHSAAHFTRVFTKEIGEPPTRWTRRASTQSSPKH
jgi:AraC-like DNA-binding protein